MLSKGALHLIALVHPKQPRVDEDARQLISNRAMHECGSNRGVDTARKSAYDSARANRRPDLGNLVLDESACGPAWLDLARTKQEIRDDLPAARRVRHLGMKRDAENRLCLVTERSQRIDLARCSAAISGG